MNYSNKHMKIVQIAPNDNEKLVFNNYQLKLLQRSRRQIVYIFFILVLSSCNFCTRPKYTDN